MTALIIAVVILTVLLICLLGYLGLLKRQMRKITRDLQKTRETSYNKQLSIQLIDRDLTEMTAAFNQNLDYQKSLKLEAEHSQNQLKQSISDIAHDLRTPVTVIKGNLQRLAMEPQLQETVREYVQICSDKTDMLKTMVDDFFELSFLESESAEAELTRLDLTKFTVQFLVDHEALIRQRHIEPAIQLPEKSVFVLADEQLLLRIYGNLLSNVMRHTRDTFSLEVREEDGQIVITFANPVKEEEKPDTAHIFDRTYRGDKARTGGGPGGLGLYIVKLLAKKQGAQVRAECRRIREKQEDGRRERPPQEVLAIEILFPVKN